MGLPVNTSVATLLGPGEEALTLRSSERGRIPLPGSGLGPLASQFPCSGQTAVSHGRFAK